MKLSRNVRKWRRAIGWTQQELAKRTELSFTEIAKIEQGLATNCRITTLLKLADAFDVSIDYLIGRMKNESVV